MDGWVPGITVWVMALRRQRRDNPYSADSFCKNPRCDATKLRTTGLRFSAHRPV